MPPIPTMATLRVTCVALPGTSGSATCGTRLGGAWPRRSRRCRGCRRLAGTTVKAADALVAVPVALVEDGVGKPGLLLPGLDPPLHPAGEGLHHLGVVLGDVGLLLGVLDEVVELHRRLEVEVGLQGPDQLPRGRPPAVLAHPGAFGDVDLGVVGGRLAPDHLPSGSGRRRVGRSRCSPAPAGWEPGPCVGCSRRRAGRRGFGRGSG